MQLSTAWRVISLAHDRSYIVHAVKYMISMDDHALILYDHERSIGTFHPHAWDIIIKADALDMLEQHHRVEISIPDHMQEEPSELPSAR